MVASEHEFPTPRRGAGCAAPLREGRSALEGELDRAGGGRARGGLEREPDRDRDGAAGAAEARPGLGGEGDLEGPRAAGGERELAAAHRGGALAETQALRRGGVDARGGLEGARGAGLDSQLERLGLGEPRRGGG